MFRWTEESIRWWQRARAYTNHYKEMAELVLPYLEKDETLFDIGCGLGYIDIELAPCVKQIKAFDIEEKVLRELKKEVEIHKRTNISVSNENWLKLPDQSCDSLLACSFGSMEEYLEDFLRIAGKQVLILKRNRSKFSQKYYKGKPVYSVAGCESYLKENKIPFEKVSVYSDFGQPLESLEEAEAFVLFHRINGNEPIKEYLEQHLEPGRYGYPYYLSNRKEMSLFIISKENLLDEKGNENSYRS